MIKHTLTIRRLLPMNYFTVFDHFIALVFKWLSRAFSGINGVKLQVFNNQELPLKRI